VSLEGSFQPDLLFVSYILTACIRFVTVALLSIGKKEYVEKTESIATCGLTPGALQSMHTIR